MRRINVYKPFLAFVLFICGMTQLNAQSLLVFDTLLLPGHIIQKVSASACSDVWCIEGNTSRGLYRYDGSGILHNNSAALSAMTPSAFSDLLCTDTNEVVIGTFNDYAYSWKSGVIYKIKQTDGLTDSTVNAVDGQTAGGMKPPTVGISTGTGGFLSTANSYTSYSQAISGANRYDYLEFANSTAAGNYILDRQRSGGNADLIDVRTNASVFQLFPGSLYPLINTATETNYTVVGNTTNTLAGTDSGLVFFSPSTSFFLHGKNINKVIKCGKTDILVGSDSLYIFNYNSTPKISKCAYPQNRYKVNDIDISPTGCIWLATDSGLVRLKDINCADFKSGFAAGDTSLIYSKACTVNFNPVCAGCANNFQWNFGDTTTAMVSAPAHTYPQSGIYSVTLIASNGFCSDTIRKNIHVLKCCDSSYFYYANLRSQDTVCGGTTIKPLDAGVFPSCHYLWSTGDTTHAILPVGTGTYWVKITTQGGCVSTDTMHVTVMNKPTVSFTGLASTYCSNHPAVVLRSTPSAGTFSGSGMSGDTLHPGNATGGTHQIIFTYTGPPGCSGADTQSVIIHIAPVARFTPLAPFYCLNADSIKLIGSPLGGVFSGRGIFDTIFKPNHAGVGKDTVTYIFIDTNGCSDTSRQAVLIKPIPTVNASGLLPQYCYTAPSSTLTGTPAGGTFAGNGMSGNVFSPGSAIGMDTIQYTFTDTNTCTNNSTLFTNVFKQPVVSVSGPSSVCPGKSSVLGAQGNGTFSWSTGNTADSITVSPSSTTTYTVTVTNPCGSASQIHVLTIQPLPNVHASADTTILTGTSAHLSASGGSSYSWSPGNGLSCPSCPVTEASPASTTLYCVTVSDTSGCTKSACVTVTVEDNCNIFIPTAFTPGRGGVNALECVLGDCIESVVFSIYDRWGERVFQGSGQRVCWDGTYKGEDLDSAVFVYMVDATMSNGAHVTRKGNISLIR